MYHAYSIASDIDGTMCQNTGDINFLRYLETNGCTNACAIFRQTHSWEKATGLAAADINELYTAFMASFSYIPPPPLPKAPEAFSALSRRNNIHLITSRSPETRKVTLSYISQHFPCRIASSTFGSMNRKAANVKKLRAYAYFEDNPKHALEVASVASVILIPSPLSTKQLLHPQIILTQAHRELASDMSAADWQQTWQRTWEEIPYIVNDLRATIHSTAVRVNATTSTPT